MRHNCMKSYLSLLIIINTKFTLRYDCLFGLLSRYIIWFFMYEFALLDWIVDCGFIYIVQLCQELFLSIIIATKAILLLAS
jgi:hypothetical protein